MNYRDYLVDEEDRTVVEASGWGERKGLGERPAVLVIEAQYKFAGLDAHIMESIKAYPISIGARAWSAIRNVEKILEAARLKNVPIFYITSGGMDPRFDTFAPKKRGWGSKGSAPAPWPAGDIVYCIAPREGDIKLHKFHPGCFFGTPLMTYLNTLHTDTLIVTGFVTGGGVRATVVEAASYNYKIALPEDAVADRIKLSHNAALVDLDMKHADVMKTAECIDYLRVLPVQVL